MAHLAALPRAAVSKRVRQQQRQLGAPSESAFGDLAKVCGEGNFKIKADEAGKGTDKLYLAVANDRSAQIKPGLNKVLYDASVAFAGWCNNGGVGGLPIKIIDMDAGLFNVEPAMTTACKDAFAMVGGGLVRDSLEFSRVRKEATSTSVE